MIIECGRRFWTPDGWSRCVLDRKHGGLCQERPDTAEDIHRRAVFAMGEVCRP